MSIFCIIGISVLITVCLWIIYGLIPVAADWYDTEEKDRKHIRISLIILAVSIIVGTCIGIGINTENERVYVKKYLAQKQTIEMSLASEELTGLERVQLVTKATEINGEFAEKKARLELWHFVVYDNTIYDGVELIDLTFERN